MAHTHSPRRAQPASALTELLGGAAFLVVMMGLLAFGYIQQGYPAIQTDGAPALSALMFATLGGGLAIVLVAFAVFLSKGSNQRAAERGLET